MNLLVIVIMLVGMLEAVRYLWLVWMGLYEEDE